MPNFITKKEETANWIRVHRQMVTICDQTIESLSLTEFHLKFSGLSMGLEMLRQRRKS